MGGRHISSNYLGLIQGINSSGEWNELNISIRRHR